MTAKSAKILSGKDAKQFELTDSADLFKVTKVFSAGVCKKKKQLCLSLQRDQISRMMTQPDASGGATWKGSFRRLDIFNT